MNGLVKKFICVILSFSFVLLLLPSATGMLGVSSYAATKIVDAVYHGLGVWMIIGLIITGGGFMAIAIASFRRLVKKFGRRVAIAF